MNVLIAAEYATPASGNFVASVLELGIAMRQHGDQLMFLFPRNGNTTREGSWVEWLEENGFPVYLLDRRIPEAEQLDTLERILREREVDVLHLHFAMFHHLAMQNAKRWSTKILIHDHMDFAETSDVRKQKLRCFLRSALYRKNRISIVSVNPEKNRAYALARHWYVPNGLSLRRNVLESDTRETCRDEIGLAPEDRMVLFLGWDVHRKGLDIAVKAVEMLHRENPHILLGIVGIGDPPRQERLDYIQQTTGICPTSAWIRYLPSREDMFAYHRAVDVYLSASRSEAFSYGLLEAISQNTPVAVSDIKGTSWCFAYDKAVAYATEDAEKCAQAIQTALQMGRKPSNCEQLVESYHIQNWCDRMMQIYHML